MVDPTTVLSATVFGEPLTVQEPVAAAHYSPGPLAEEFLEADDWLQNLDLN